MYKIYYLVSESTKWYYIGMTKNSLKIRFTQHASSARREVKSPLYDCMRKHSDFLVVLKADGLTYEEACELEKKLIREARELSHSILNLADGGEGGFVILNVEDWKNKLKAARAGRKPALGMKHSEENKRLFSKVSKEYWSSQETYKKEEILQHSFRDATSKFGISKTHYYRLKRALLSE